MTDTKHSRYLPQHTNWYKDLPARDESDSEDPNIFDNLNHVDDTFLEISRSSSKLRGVMLFFGIPLFPIAILLMIFASDVSSLVRDLGWLSVLFPISICGLLATGIHGIRLDTTTPRDEPVRFNRKRSKVYLYEYKHNWNPFGRWGAVIKEFDWNTLQAEVTREAGFNGKIYLVYYALNLVSLKPGTNEVVERFKLVSNPSFDTLYPSLWAYLKQYMRGEAIAQSEAPIRDQSISLRNSIVEWLPYLDFSAHGREWVKEPWLILLTLITLPAAPIMILIALCHYIALRVAPAAAWPPTLDLESRSPR